MPTATVTPAEADERGIQMPRGTNAAHPLIGGLPGKWQYDQDRRKNPSQPAPHAHPKKNREHAMLRLSKRDCDRQRNKANQQRDCPRDFPCLSRIAQTCRTPRPKPAAGSAGKGRTPSHPPRRLISQFALVHQNHSHRQRVKPERISPAEERRRGSAYVIPMPRIEK